MTSENQGQRNLIILPLSLAVWISAFALIYNTAGIMQIPENPALFLAAAFLTLLSVFVVHGFSCLQQHRSIYLLIGALAAVATFYAARPMVERSRDINRSGNIPGLVLFITADCSGIVIPAEPLLMDTRNAIFARLSNETKQAIPERPWMIMLLALCQLTLAAGLGLWIGEGIDEISHLIPVALVATIADIWSVSAGATAKIIISPIINYFLLRFPMPGHAEIPYLIGLSDFLFFAIFYQAARRFDLGTVKNAILLSSSFLAAIAAAIFFSTGLPVLPFMAAIFVAGNFSKLRLKREEMKQIAVFVFFILLVFAIITYLAH